MLHDDTSLVLDKTSPLTHNPEVLGSLPRKNRAEDGLSPDAPFPKDSLAQMLDLELKKRWLFGKSKQTQRAYSRIIDELLAHLHPRSLKDADLEFLQAFVNLQKSRKTETLRQRTAALKSLFKFAEASRYLPQNPASLLESIKPKRKTNERFLTKEEILSIIGKGETHRDRTLMKLLYNSGARISELCNLKWKDVLPTENERAILQIEGKGGGIRSVTISKGTFQDLLLLKLQSTKDDHFIFQTQMSESISANRVREIITDCALRAGITKKVSPHWFRHAHATHSYKNGVQLHVLQKTLGHAYISTTGLYLDSLPEETSGDYLDI